MGRICLWKDLLHTISMKSQEFLRGVNLGGWLVLEKWMTPSLFMGTDATDEHTFMQSEGASAKLEKHRKTFITEADFEWLSENGVNAVRIPVGYWLFESDEPYVPAIEYLDWAVAMAKKYELKVLIDLHAARGSQNGRDHSGRVGRAEWYREKSYREQTVDVLGQIAEYYADEPTVWGVELLNEPRVGVLQWRLRHFYKKTYRRIVQVGRPGLHVVFHDAFTPRLLSGVLWAEPRFPVVMDVHWYHFLDWFVRWRSIEGYFRKVRHRPRLIAWLQWRQPIIVGEWSAVISDKTMKKYPKKEEREYFQRHGQLQLEAYGHAAGWFYWTYKTEEPGIWNFRSLIENGDIILK